MAGKKPTAAPKKQVAGKDRPYSKLESLIKDPDTQTARRQTLPAFR